MHDTIDKVVSIESRLKISGVTLGAFFREADIDRSTWSRWRSGGVGPTLANWLSACAAADRLCVNAPRSPSSDDTGPRIGGSSPGPIPEISQSQVAAERSDFAEPARAGVDIESSLQDPSSEVCA